jgi:hypothetical protein
MHEVTLEDVLAAKHLPPLSLKDFEEYLLFEERSVENLYFTVWLKDYTSRYNCMLSNDPTTITPSYLSHSDIRRIPGKSPCDPDLLFSPSLALSFTRAKRTFFHHTSSLELNLTSVTLTNLLMETRGIAHPPPQVFDDVAKEVRDMMRQSLHKFIAARYGNVGTSRAVCGVIAGLVMIGIGLIPIFLSIFNRRTRLIRLAALPFFWFGCTVLLSALRGICLGIYFFGDARQLYSFELARPPISYPLSCKSTSDIESTIHQPEDQKLVPEPSLARSVSVESVPPSTYTKGSPLGSEPITEIIVQDNGPRFSTDNSALPSPSDHPVHSKISEPPSHLITISPIQFHRRFAPPETATFIPSFYVPPTSASTTSFSPATAYAYTYVQQPPDYQPHSKYYQEPSSLPGPTPKPLLQPLIFDFDALPDPNVLYQESPRSTTLSRSLSLGGSDSKPLRTIFSHPRTKSINLSSTSWLGFPLTNRPSVQIPPPSRSHACPSYHPNDEVIIGGRPSPISQIRPHRHQMMRVPAFGPLTKILSPVVLRYQWLILMQSAVISALLTAALLGIAIAFPGPW